MDGDRPAITVITATFNRSHALRCAIRSVRSQTWTDWEMIIVGDRCTDDTADVVASFDDPRITFVNLRSRVGEQSGPHNLAISRARGDILAFLNHDDVWLPEHLARCRETLLVEHADIAHGVAANIGAKAPIPLQFDDLDIALVGVGHRGSYSPSMRMDAVVPASTMTIRRSGMHRLERWRFSRETVIEPSQDLIFRAWKARMRIRSTGVVSVVLASAGHRPGSYTTTAAPEAQWVVDRLEDPSLGVELAALALETNAAWERRATTRTARLSRAAARVLAAVGVNPRAVTFRIGRRMRRGSYLTDLRALRGVPLPDESGSDAVQLRARMVDEACTVEIGERVEFAAGRGGARLLAGGWSRPDSLGVWNDGRSATLVLAPPPFDDGLVISLSVQRADGRPQRVHVSTPRRGLCDLVVDDGHSGIIEVRVEAADVARGRLVLHFELPDAASPRSLGHSDDERSIAIGLRSLDVDLAEPASRRA